MIIARCVLSFFKFICYNFFFFFLNHTSYKCYQTISKQTVAKTTIAVVDSFVWSFANNYDMLEIQCFILLRNATAQNQVKFVVFPFQICSIFDVQNRQKANDSVSIFFEKYWKRCRNVFNRKKAKENNNTNNEETTNRAHSEYRQRVKKRFDLWIHTHIHNARMPIARLFVRSFTRSVGWNTKRRLFKHSMP